MDIEIGAVKVRPTRFPELCYANLGRGEWRFLDSDSGAAIGPHYQSKAELMGDLTRYATDYGCEATK